MAVMKSKLLMFLATIPLAAQAQSQFEAELCEAATNNRTIEMVYDKDASKGCEPRLIDVHQVAIGNNGSLYMHGWQFRGCTKGRDFEAKRIFKFEKIKSVKLIDSTFGEKSQAAKDAGWDGCIGSNCFIKENICE
ncbi:WYL domain-containing protein [Planktotalea frisia]|nr:WYL domain-containing protein [Planktotalea frisia]